MSKPYTYPPLPEQYRERYFAAKLSGYLDIQDLNPPEVWCLGQYLGYWLSFAHDDLSKNTLSPIYDYVSGYLDLHGSFSEIECDTIIVTKVKLDFVVGDPKLDIQHMIGVVLDPPNFETRMSYVDMIRLRN